VRHADADRNPPIPGSFAWPWFNRLSLRKKTLFVGAGRLVLLMLVLGLGLHYLARKGFDRLEQQYLVDHVVRVDQALAQSVRALERYVHDYAVWDDTYSFVLLPTRKYVDDNFNPEALVNLRVSHAFILDRNLRLVAGRRIAPDGRSAMDLDPGSLAFSAPMGEEVLKRGKVSTSGMVRIGSELFVAAACQILPTNGLGSPQGVFFHLKPVNQELIREYSELLRIDLALTTGPETQVPLPGKTSDPDFTILDRAPDRLTVGIPVKDMHGRPLGRLEAVLPRSIQQQARQFILLVYLALAAVLVATTLLWPRTMHWLVLGRLERIHGFLDLLGRKQTLAERLPAREGDELDALAMGINRTLDTLEKAQRLKDESEAGVHRLQEQLIQIQKVEAIATMAGGVAHDFNNSLSAIMGSLELAHEELPADHPTQKHITRMKKAGSAACALAKQMLNLSRASTVQKAPIHLGEAVGDVLKLVRAGLPKSIEIQFHNDAFDDVVLVDATQLQQVVMNLATNASHAMANQPLGCIDVSIREARLPDVDRHPETLPLPAGEYLRLVFSDNGHGIPAEILSKVFDPFFTTKPAGSGTGLGLAMAQGFVARHEGSLGLQSQPGQGATFTIHLPKHREGVQASEGSETRRLRLLLVDDDTHGRETMAEGLRRLGHQVTEAANGTTALKLVEEDPAAFEAIVTDQLMPGMTGLDLGEALLERSLRLPVFLISGYTGPIEAKSLRTRGIVSLFLKPVALAELDHALHSATKHGGA